MIKKIEVIIQNLNYGKTLEGTIASAISLIHDGYELAITGMDAGSTDNSISLYRKYPQVNFLDVTGKTQAQANNEAVMQSDADYFAFINSDDLYLPWFLQDRMRIFESKPGTDIVCGETFWWDTDRRYCQLWKPEDCFLTRIRELINQISWPTALFSRSAFEKAGHFDESFIYAFDFEYWLRCIYNNPKVNIEKVNNPGNIYRIYSTNLTFSKTPAVLAEIERLKVQYG